MACNIGSAMSQGTSQKVQLETQYAKNLMEAAEKRFETTKNCRNELQKAFIDYRKQKFDHERTIREERTNIRSVELKHRSNLLKMKAECKKKANDEYEKYRGVAYNTPHSDVTTLSGFNARVGEAWQNFFNRCVRDDLYLDQVKLLNAQLQNEIEKEENKSKHAMEALKELHLQTSMIQDLITKNCQDAMALRDYQEAMIRYIHGKAMAGAAAAARQNVMGALLSCLTGLGGGGSSANSNTSL